MHIILTPKKAGCRILTLCCFLSTYNILFLLFLQDITIKCKITQGFKEMFTKNNISVDKTNCTSVQNMFFTALWLVRIRV